ncbi:MAG: hypothetical protein ABI184_02510, partial [Ginsengibacter sp.]
MDSFSQVLFPITHLSSLISFSPLLLTFAIMKEILLFGAGKSATCLIDYLGKCCDLNKWKFIVCDSNLALAQSKTTNFSSAEAVSFDVSNESMRHKFISKADMVIS